MDKIIRRIKKEYLLLKKDRELKSSVRVNELLAVLAEENFKIIPAEIAHSFFMQFQEKNKKNLNTIDPEIVNSKKLVENRVKCINRLFTGSLFIVVFPFDWEVFGALIITRDEFFTKYEEITHVLDDGIYILNDNLSLAVKIRQERQISNFEIDYMEVSELVLS